MFMSLQIHLHGKSTKARGPFPVGLGVISQKQTSGSLPVPLGPPITLFLMVDPVL
jgi:hypothetical protein